MYGFLKQEKEIVEPFRLFFCFKNPYSFLDLILRVLKITLWIFSILRQKFQVIFNTCKNNENIIPSAMGQKRRQVCGFLCAYWGVSDCFCGKVDAKNSIRYSVFRWQKKYIRNGMAAAFPLKQLLLIFWQIKKHTLAGFLVLWVLKMALTIRKL